MLPSNTISKELQDAARALRDSLWTAVDIGRNTNRQLVNLLASGQRKGVIQSPDAYYSVGCILLGKHRAYTLTIPPSDAVYTNAIVTSKRKQGSSFLSKLTDGSIPEQSIVEIDNSGNRPVDVRIQEGAKGPHAIDSTSHHGPSMLWVRQYFNRAVDPENYSLHCPILTVHQTSRPSNQHIPLKFMVGSSYLSTRLRFLFTSALAVPMLNKQKNEFVLGTRLLSVVSSPFLRKLQKSHGVDCFRYSLCELKLKKGERLRIDYHPRGTKYFCFTMVNRYCQITHITAHANSFQLSPNNDGSYTLYVSESSCNGIANHIATHGASYCFLREILPTVQTGLPATLIERALA